MAFDRSGYFSRWYWRLFGHIRFESSEEAPYSLAPPDNPISSQEEPTHAFGIQIVHEVVKVESEELEKITSSQEPCEPHRLGGIPRNLGESSNSAGLAANDSPFDARGEDESRMTSALRMRAVNTPLPRRSRPERLETPDNHRRPKKRNTRTSTLYKNLKKDDYYWF